MQPLRLLHLEDDPLDAELVRAHLAEAGFVCDIVSAQDRAGFELALLGAQRNQQPFDIILSDYSLPSFDGLAALDLLRNAGWDTPFLLVSGALGEDRAIESLKRGATDYVLKQRLDRLGPSVERALRESREKRRRQLAEEALRVNEERFRIAAEALKGGIYDFDIPKNHVYRSDRFHQVFGGIDDGSVAWWQQRVHPDDRDKFGANWENVSSTQPDNSSFSLEYRVISGDGTIIYCWDQGIVLRDPTGKPNRIIGSMVDASDLYEAQRAARVSDAFVVQMIQSSADCITLLDRDHNTLFMNHSGRVLREISSDLPASSIDWLHLWSEDDRTTAEKALIDAGRGRESRFQGLSLTQTGKPKWWDVALSPVRDPDGRIERLMAVSREITEQRRAQETLRERQRQIEDLNTRLQRAIAESHHRIKNNLQVLVALVETMRFASNRTTPTVELDRLTRHIRALAALHDLLTQEVKTPGADLDTVSIRAALERLIPVLETAAGQRRIVCVVDDIRLNLKQCTAVSLLVNELVANAIKHGRGEVSVTIHLLNPSDDSGPCAELEVSDDGPGFPPGFSPATAAHTGIDLIESIGRWDLSGEILYENPASGGASVTVTFPVLPPESDTVAV